MGGCWTAGENKWEQEMWPEKLAGFVKGPCPSDVLNFFFPNTFVSLFVWHPHSPAHGASEYYPSMSRALVLWEETTSFLQLSSGPTLCSFLYLLKMYNFGVLFLPVYCKSLMGESYYARGFPSHDYDVIFLWIGEVWLIPLTLFYWLSTLVWTLMNYSKMTVNNSFVKRFFFTWTEKYFLEYNKKKKPWWRACMAQLLLRAWWKQNTNLVWWKIPLEWGSHFDHSGCSLRKECHGMKWRGSNRVSWSY